MCSSPRSTSRGTLSARPRACAAHDGEALRRPRRARGRASCGPGPRIDRASRSRSKNSILRRRERGAPLSSPIVDVHAREILDSRGNPTVEVDASLESDASAAPRSRPARPPATSRRSSCATATRAAYLGKGVRQRRRQRRTVIAPALVGMDPDAPGQAMDSDLVISNRRHRQQGPSSAPTPILGVSLAVARAAADAAGAAALPLPRRRRCARAAGADDERDQRRRACGQHARHPGVHGRAGRLRHASPRRLRAGVEVFHTLKKVLDDRRPRDRRRRRGRVRARPRPQRGGARADRRGHRERPATGSATEICARPRRRRAPSSIGEGSTVYEGEGRSRRGDEMVDYCAGLVETYPIVSIEDGAGRGRLGRDGRR